MPRASFPVTTFLREASLGNPPKMGEKVVVIGGGNVAIDAARTAVRLGAGRVTAVALENEEELPAWPWEVEEALEEGVALIHRWGPPPVPGGERAGQGNRVEVGCLRF